MIPAGAERPRREDSDGQTVVFWRCSLCGALLLLTHGSQGLNSGWLEMSVQQVKNRLHTKVGFEDADLFFHEQ